MTKFFYLLTLASIHSAAVYWASLDSSEKALAKIPAAQCCFQDMTAAGSYLLAMTVNHRNCLRAIAVMGRVPPISAQIDYWA